MFLKMSKIIEKLKTKKATRPEIVKLLGARGDLQKELFETARKIRQQYFGDKVFVRGVIEVSNCCRKNCDYCAMRYSNKELKRYRLTPKEILSIAKEIRSLGIQTLFIQSGEDIIVDKIIQESLPRIKRKLRFNNIILCLGNRTKKQYKKFKELGASAYILKFETSDREFFEKMGCGLLRQRLDCLKWLRELGFEVGTGNITGLPGQSLESIADDILLAKKLNPDFVSTAPFIPNENTPLQNRAHGGLNLTLNTMAIWRIMLPDVLIPTVSALEKIEEKGQLQGLNAGANVITINFTPPTYREKYRIYSKKRFVVSYNHALKTIKLARLKADICEIFPEKKVLPYFEEKFGRKSNTFKLNPERYRDLGRKPEEGIEIFIKALKEKKLREKKRIISVLDLGCGDGRLPIQYARNGFKVEGIDFSSNAITILRKRAKYHKVSDLVNGKTGDILKVDYGKNRFDGVSCLIVLHLFDDQGLKKIIGKMKRATKQDGFNYISLQSEFHCKLPDGREFTFENYTNWKTEKLVSFLKDLYRSWKIIKMTKEKYDIEVPMQNITSKYLKANFPYFKNKGTRVDFIAKKTKSC